MRATRALATAVALLFVLSLTPSPAVAGDLHVSGKVVSEAASGPPLEVTSSERVDNLNADRLDGFDAADFAPANHSHAGVPYAHMIVVSPSGGDFTSIQAAIDSITDASAANPYLVWVGPGVYEEVLTIGDGIDLHGAGRNLVTVRNPDPASAGALVTLLGDGELRSLTIESSIAGSVDALTVAYGILISQSSPRLVDVAVRSTVQCDDPALNFRSTGIKTYTGASPTLEQVTVEAQVTGSQASGFCNALAFDAVLEGVPVLNDVTLVAEGADVSPGSSLALALYGEGSLPLVRSSVLMATGADFANRALQTLTYSGHTGGVRVAHSQVIGSTQGSNIVCIGAYDADFAPLGAGCT